MNFEVSIKISNLSLAGMASEAPWQGTGNRHANGAKSLVNCLGKSDVCVSVKKLQKRQSDGMLLLAGALIRRFDEQLTNSKVPRVQVSAGAVTGNS